MDFRKCVTTVRNGIRILFLRRSVAAILGFLCLSMTEMHRSNLSFAVVDMVNSSTIDRGHHGDNATEIDCPENVYNSSTLPKLTGEFFWNPELQGYILSAAFISGAIGQVPGGIATQKFGSKKVLVSSILVSSACNLISPWIVRIDIYVFIILHFIKGLAVAMSIVPTSVIASNWFPRKERSLAGTFMNSGFTTGTFLCFISAGSICELELWNGWPLVFYIFGLLGVFLAISLQIFYNNLPEEDPWITQSELTYIQDGKDRTNIINRPPTPWAAVLKTKSVYFMIVALIGQRWMVFYLKIVNPIYFGTILNLPIKQNGLLSAGPFILSLSVSWLTSYMSLYLNRYFILQINRKFFNSLGTIAFCVGLLGMYFAKCDISGNAIGVFIATTSLGLCHAGVFITAVDITPTFCGPVFGLTHSIGNISGFLLPLMVGELTNGAQNMLQWQKIILTSIGITFGFNLLWVLLGSTTIEPWDPASSGPKRAADQSKDDLQTEAVSSKM